MIADDAQERMEYQRAATYLEKIVEVVSPDVSGFSREENEALMLFHNSSTNS